MVEWALSASPNRPSRGAAHLPIAAPLARPPSPPSPPAGSAAVSRTAASRAASFDAPSPTAASIGGRSLLYEPLPADLLWPVRPPSPTVAPVLDIGVNRLALFRAVDAAVDAAVQPSQPDRAQRSGSADRAGTKKRRPVGLRELTVEEQVDQQCAAAAAFHYQQQLKLDVSHPVRSAKPPASAASSTQATVADTVRSLTAASSSAHRYRLYTDSLIDVGLHHEAELRRHWVAMETQARSINRSAERAARRDMRETVREIVSAARAGRCNEVRDKLKEATQHRDEANEARNSRAAIYTDSRLYLPMSRSRQREAAVLAGLAGEKSSVGHLSTRQALFDPVPHASDFERPAAQHVSAHQFRDDHRDGTAAGRQAEIALPAVVDSTRRRMEQLEQDREERKRDDDNIKRMQRAEHRRRHRMQQAEMAASEQRRHPKVEATPLPQPPPPLSSTAATRRPRTGPQSSVRLLPSRPGSSATVARRGSLRAPLWTQEQGDAMLADVSQFTLLRSKEDERRKAEERRAIADDERRAREQWLADERREERERAQKEHDDWQRRRSEQEEDEREDRERRLRFFPPPPRPQLSDRPTEQSADAAERRDESEAADHFSHTTPLPAAAHSPDRPQVSLSASDSSHRRRSSIAVGPRRISLAGTAGLLSGGHRRHSSLLPPPSPSLSSSRTSTSSRSYRSSLAAPAAFPLSQVRSRWQNAAGKTGKEHLARRFSLVAASDASQTSQQAQSHSQHQQQQQQQQQQHRQPAMAAMLPAPIDPESSLVATNYSHDPLHSVYLTAQREQRRTATAQVYDTVKRWLEEQEEDKRVGLSACFNTSVAPTAAGTSAAATGRAPSLSFDPELVTPFSSILAHQPYSPRSQQRHRSMRQQLPLSVSNPAVFAWMRRHAIVPRRTIDPSEEVKYRAMFNELDVDGSGLLDTGELLGALQATHGLRLSEAELHQLLTGMDIRFQGHLSFQQFVSQFASMDEWESLFRIWAKRRQRRMAAAARSRPATSPPTDRPASPSSNRRPLVSSLRRPTLPSRPVSSASPAPLASLRSSATSRPPSSTANGAPSLAAPDVDVLVPFLLWVPAFHRLQLLESLMAVQLTADEEAAVRQSAEQPQPAPSAALTALPGGATGLSLLDLWRVTRTQVRRKRMEGDKAEAMRLKQLQAAEGGRAKRGRAGAAYASTGTAAEQTQGGGEAEEEKVMEIWLELHGERERRLEEKRRWRAQHSSKQKRGKGGRSGDDSEADTGQQRRMAAFDLFKQAAQMSMGETVQ